MINYLNLNEERIVPVVEELNSLLASYQLYYQKLRNFHWNVRGRNFFELHGKFEEMYMDARIKIDEIAERVLTLGHRPLSNLSQYLDHASIAESADNLEDAQMVRELLKSHRRLIEQMQMVISRAEKASDEGTLDMIGAYVRELEKASWMLDAWVNQAERSRKKVSA
jgi:starvation-inducible DNA-binding protein